MKNKWISVKDGLPEKMYIIMVDYSGNVSDGFFSKGKFYCEYNHYARMPECEVRATHWMYFPNPPEKTQ